MPVQVQQCESLGQALELIRRDHVPNRWLYRGQTYRRLPHRITDENQTFELENLYPGSFRFAASFQTISDTFAEKWRQEYDKADALFNAFNSFLISKYEATRYKEPDRFRWMDPFAEELSQLFKGAGPSVFSGFHERGMGLKNPAFIRLSWSLSQHYGVVTALLDLTFDPDVAAWFATNLWETPRAPQALEGSGVIYRFDVATLMAGLIFRNQVESASGANPFKAPPDKAFVQDLREVPTAFALRPPRQEAAVVSGFDDLQFARQFDVGGKIDAFIFPHFADQLLRWPPKYSREHLIPPDDPFLDLYTEFNSKWRPHAEEIYGVKYTKPVMILTANGPKFASIPGNLAGQRESKREQSYDLGMESLGKDLRQAESRFNAVIEISRNGVVDRLSSLAYARLALIRFLRNDFLGAAEALEKSLDGPDRSPQEGWVGRLLQTIAQGAQMLRTKGQGQLALPVLRRLAAIARRAGPGALALEAELGATVLVGALEFEGGRPQLGVAALESIARRPVSGLTPPQRFFVADALHALAQAYEALGESALAMACYTDIVGKFAGDVWPKTVHIVAEARTHV